MLVDYNMFGLLVKLFYSYNVLKFLLLFVLYLEKVNLLCMLKIYLFLCKIIFLFFMKRFYEINWVVVIKSYLVVVFNYFIVFF